jgi:hypothetical protein
MFGSRAAIPSGENTASGFAALSQTWQPDGRVAFDVQQWQFGRNSIPRACRSQL